MRSARAACLAEFEANSEGFARTGDQAGIFDLVGSGKQQLGRDVVERLREPGG